MLKLRIILTSALILLLVGLDMNVRAAVDSKKVNSKSTEKDESKKKSNEHEPKEIITDLDFFGAFSLVNIQLQWRDLSSVLNNEATDAESSINPIGLSLQELENLALDVQGKTLPASASINSALEVIPTRTFRSIDGNSHFIHIQNKQCINTIAYIQNCSTLPQNA